MDTEIERLRSRSLAQIVVEKLHLEDDPEFNQTLRTPSWVESALLRDRQALLRIMQPLTPAEPNILGESDRIIKEFIRHLGQSQYGSHELL